MDFLKEWKSNKNYFSMLKLMAGLSRLFSESEIPYLDYRLAENLFCKYYKAINDARSCTAYDARLNSLGIGIKTFILDKGDSSLEKIAEFNKLKVELDKYSGIKLAKKLGEFRNERMLRSNNAYNIHDSRYHIVGRKKALLRVFNTAYDEVNVEKIRLIKNDATSIAFEDGLNEYSFNRSKSVLMKRFHVPSVYEDVLVDIITDPLCVLESVFLKGKCDFESSRILKKGKDYVVLPLYSTRTGVVPEHSGLNQWNAGGRSRDENELYIPVPKKIHTNYPRFFPRRDCPFELVLPNGCKLSAKICQEGGKALMSNPNKDLGKWFLRDVLGKKSGKVVTKLDLDIFGIDSVLVEKLNKKNQDGLEVFKISFADNYESYGDFMGE